MVNLILNVPLFLLSLRSMGVGFGVRSLIGSAGLSLLLDYLPVPAMTDDLLLSAIFGGALCGAGFGLILRGHATTGGSDMLAALLAPPFSGAEGERLPLFRRHIGGGRFRVCI